MSVEVNYIAVIFAAISSMIVGSLWYMPAGFGKVWMRLTGVKPDRSKMSGGQMARMYGGVFVCSLLTAYVLAHVTFLSNKFFGGSFLWCGVTTAFWLWLGFTATRLYVHDVFESRPWKLTLLNAAHELVTVVVMGLIIGGMGV